MRAASVRSPERELLLAPIHHKRRDSANDPDHATTCRNCAATSRPICTCLKCSEIYCLECTQNLGAGCPACGAQWGASVQRVLRGAGFPKLRNKADSVLETACLNWGCKFVGTESELSKHSKMCEHTLVHCVYEKWGCPIKAKRVFLSEHLKSCRHAPATCSLCSEEVGRNKLEVSLASCQFSTDTSFSATQRKLPKGHNRLRVRYENAARTACAARRERVHQPNCFLSQQRARVHVGRASAHARQACASLSNSFAASSAQRYQGFTTCRIALER